MTELLTTRQLMDLLHLDRTTIYRMLNEGQLPAVRVGGQWRFPRDAVDAWLHGNHKTTPTETQAPKETLRVPTLDSDVLPLHCVQPIQEVFAQIADVGAVTTDLDGTPLTEFSNACAYCKLILSTEKGRARCQADWKRLAAQDEPQPRLEKCHAGLTYARGRITVEDQFIAMLFAGQFVVGDNSGLSPERVARVARACEVEEAALQQAAQSLRVLDKPRARKLLDMLQLVANTFCTIGAERYGFMTRLKRVAEIVGAAQ